MVAAIGAEFGLYVRKDDPVITRALISSSFSLARDSNGEPH